MISVLFLIAGIHSTTNLKTYGQAKNFFQPANMKYMKKSSRESMNSLLVCAPPSLDSICKYGIYAIDDIGALIAISNN